MDNIEIIKNIEDSVYFEMKAKDLKALIYKTIYAVAVEDVRPILKGVKLEINSNKITAVALDGYRLAVVKKQIVSSNAEFSCIVPARSLNEISKLLDDSDNIIKVCVGRNYLMVDVDNTKITTRLLEGDFINYSQIIPTDFTTNIILNKEQLLDSLERASLLSRVDRNNLVKFEISDKVMILSSKSEIGDIKENITISLKGKDLTIAFNARYFTEALRVIGDEFLKLNFTSSVSPCVITSNDTDEFLFLILPVRIMS
jgi:DNA polymerase-3 subunit beta